MLIHFTIPTLTSNQCSHCLIFTSDFAHLFFLKFYNSAFNWPLPPRHRSKPTPDAEFTNQHTSIDRIISQSQPLIPHQTIVPSSRFITLPSLNFSSEILPLTKVSFYLYFIIIQNSKFLSDFIAHNTLTFPALLSARWLDCFLFLFFFSLSFKAMTAS